MINERVSYFWPPCDATENPAKQVQSTATATTAANFDWTASLPAELLKTQLMLRVIAQTNDITIRFKSTNAAAATTLTNGIHIAANAQYPQVFVVDPVKHKFIDVISQTGAGTMQVQVVGIAAPRLNQ